MKIAFYIAKNGDPFDKLVAWWTRPDFFKFWVSGKYSHVEIVFDNNICFSSSPRDGGTRWTTIPDIETSGNWDFIEFDFSEYMIKQTISMCNKEQHKPYDWFCVLFSFIIPLNIQSPRSWTCSEFVSKMIFNYDYAHRISPNRLYNKLIKEKTKWL